MRFLSVLMIFGLLFMASTDCQAKTLEAKVNKLTILTAGSSKERINDLWRQSRPIIEKDAKADLSDAKYLNLRSPLFDVWGNLQFKLAWENRKVLSPASDKAQRVIPEILGLIDKLYGFPGYSNIMREKKRVAAKKGIGASLNRVDRLINALP